MKSYIQLEKEIAKINQINNVIKLLYWDITVNMQRGSADSRNNEIINLISIAHSILKSEKVIQLVHQSFEKADKLDRWQLANLQEIKREISNALCIDDELQKKFISSTTQCELVWREAKLNNDYEKLKPYLQSVLDCVKEIATIKSKKFNYSKYDSLIDIYDPYNKTIHIRETYNILKKALPSLIQKINDKQRNESVLPIAKINIEQQKLIAKKIVHILGFDFTKGRLDESAHPFCRGNPNDIRLTVCRRCKLIYESNKLRKTHKLYKRWW